MEKIEIKEFKQKYQGKVLRIYFENDKTIEGYCYGYNNDNDKLVESFLLKINDKGETKKIIISNIDKVAIITNEKQYTKYEHACNFYYAAKRCLMDIKQENIRYLVIPYMANSAFACEIFLKAIIEEKGNIYTPSHELYKLFNELLKDIKKKIKNKFKEENFEEKLRKCSKIFEDFRYLYENIYNSEEIDLNFWERFVEEIYAYSYNNLRKGTNVAIEMLL